MIGRLVKLGTVIAGLVAGGVIAATQGLSSSRATSVAVERRDRDEEAGSSHRLMKIIKLFAVFFVLLGIGGFLVATSGIIPIKASSGHWAITAWLLDFSKTRSVATHSLGLKPPPLDEPHLALKGAGHYDFGCRPCHGSPALPQPRVAWKMTPPPPYLPPKLARWEPDELFYIVKHGIKFTGMPAWPSQQRDDEVWAMVAFLRRFPQLNAEQYRQMVNGEVGPTKEVAPLQGLLGPEITPPPILVNCARCHGVDGLGRELGAYPRLAGQPPDYLALSLQAYADGQRHSGIMQPIAAGLNADEMRELSRYYASLPRPSPVIQETTSSAERGGVIAQRGIPSQRVPACIACHGPGSLSRNSVYPELAGQYADYLTLQLEIFKKDVRGGTAYAHLMRQVSAGLNAEQMRDVARYYASLTPASDAGARTSQ